MTEVGRECGREKAEVNEKKTGEARKEAQEKE